MANVQLSVATKQWLKQCLHDKRRQWGTYGLADRELARRAGLHVEEARRWL